MVRVGAPLQSPLIDRVVALEAAVRTITRAELDALTNEMEVGLRDKARAPGLEPFWIACNRGLKPAPPEKSALDLLYTRVMVGLAEGLTGRDVAAEDARPGMMARLDRLVEPRRNRRLQGLATTIIERSGAASNPWAGFVPIWNACCAVLLRERLTPEIRSELLSTWNQVFDHEPGAPTTASGDIGRH